MTVAAPSDGPVTTARPSLRHVVGDTAVVTKRNLRRIVRTPRLLVVSSIQPVMFVLLFRYVFGGAIRTPGVGYADYLLPGILVQATLFGATTAVALATDIASGMIDRFKSLPMARSTVLAARTIADLARGTVVVLLVLAVGTLVGFRFHNGPLPALAALALVLLFGFAYSWAAAWIGLIVKDPEAAQLAAYLPVFPLIFASSAFVPIDTMPGWLQAFARNQPISVTVNAVRALTQGGRSTTGSGNPSPGSPASSPSSSPSPSPTTAASEPRPIASSGP
jgi:ABC transporter DrrB family efflux protein